MAIDDISLLIPEYGSNERRQRVVLLPEQSIDRFFFPSGLDSGDDVLAQHRERVALCRRPRENGQTC